MTTAERLLMVDEGIEKTKALNTELETTLNGGDTGKKSRYDELWLGILNGGARNVLSYAFHSWGGMEYIRPPFKLIPTTGGAQQIFYGCSSLKKVEAAYFDLSQIPKGTSDASAFYYTFYNCYVLEEIEDIGICPAYSYNSTFANCKKLKRIAKMTVDETSKYAATFEQCFSLEELTIAGTIGANGFNLRHSTNLNKASITSIINALSSTTSGLTVTLSKTAVNNAFTTDEWNALIDTKKNWTISLA
jgi:hypothetical protein